MPAAADASPNADFTAGMTLGRELAACNVFDFSERSLRGSIVSSIQWKSEKPGEVP
jgi:hypothetical protein